MSSSPEVRVSESGQGPPEAVGTTLGRYRLMKKIARGGMAEVFAARSFGAHGFEKTVAIKRILPRYGDDPQFVRMMVDEAKITVLLNHPNVATILELCEQDGNYFIVMEFVPGQSLSALGRKLREGNERLGVLEASFIVVELLQGLHAAHVQKEASGKPAHIIHRDVSPQNVLVSFDGHVKVIDFGIARAKHRLEMTEVGTIKGKLRYLAPEMIDPGRFMKSGDFDHRVDVFAAGIVLWELIAHRTLYQGDDEMVVYDSITDSDAPDLARMGMCDAALSKIVAKSLTRDPEKRYLTAEEFADDLRAYVYRTDPAFTVKRIAAVMERVFPKERDEMLALERGADPTRLAEESDPQATAYEPHPAPHLQQQQQQPAQPAPPTVASPHPAGSTLALSSTAGGPEPGPRPVAPNAETRTQHVSASGPRPRPTIPAQPGVKPDAPTASGPPAPAAATKQMRTSDSSNKRQPSAREQLKVMKSQPSNKNAIPIPDDMGPAQGDVLTVMTLVSKSGDAQAAPAASAKQRAEDFKAGGDTATVSEDPQAARGRAGERFDETPHTEERERLPTSGSMSRGRRRQTMSPRLIGLSAASGIGIAVIGIIAANLSAPAEPEVPPSGRVTAKLPPPVVKEPVKVIVRCTTPGATAIALGNERPVPAEFTALPGDNLEVIVKAPGHVDKSVPVSVPRDQRGDLVQDVVLDEAHVPLTLQVTPADAIIEIGEGVAYRPGMLVAPGVPIVVIAGKPGYVTEKREVVPEAGVPLIVTMVLSPDKNVVELIKDPGLVAEPREVKEPREPREKRPVVTAKTATLVLKTKPVWGQVTIDGKTYEETTPLTVELKPGKHSVTIAHPPKGWKKTFNVNLKPGETETKMITFE